MLLVLPMVGVVATGFSPLINLIPLTPLSKIGLVRSALKLQTPYLVSQLFQTLNPES